MDLHPQIVKPGVYGQTLFSLDEITDGGFPKGWDSLPAGESEPRASEAYAIKKNIMTGIGPTKKEWNNYNMKTALHQSLISNLGDQAR